MKKKKQSSLVKLDFSQFGSYCVNLLIYAESILPQMNPAVIFLLIIFGNLQLISFILVPHFNSRELEAQQDILSLLFKCSLLSRPNLLIASYFKLQNNIVQLFYIPIVLLFGGLFLLLILDFLLFRKQFQQKQILIYEYLTSLSILNNQILYVISFIGQTFNIYFFLFFCDVLITCTTFSMQDLLIKPVILNAINFIFSILALGFFLIYCTFRVAACSEQLAIKSKNFQQLHITFSEFFYYLFLFLLPIISLVFEDSAEVYIQFTIIGTISILNINKWVFSLNFYTINLINFQIIMISLVATVMIMIIQQSIFQTFFDLISVLIIFIFPLIARFLLSERRRIVFSILFNPIELQNAQIVQFHLIFMLSIFENLEHYELILVTSMLLATHRKNCKNTRCFCQNKNFQTIDARNIILFNQEQINEYVLQQSSFLAKKANRIKNASERFSYYVHYISLVNELGQSTYAFQQTNHIIYSNSKSNYFNSAQRDGNAQNFKNQSQTISQLKRQKTNHSSQSDSKSYQYNSQTSGSQTFFYGKTTSFIQNQKILILQDQIKKKMSHTFLLYSQNKNLSSEAISHSVHLFLQSEENKSDLKVKIVSLIQQKLGFFSLLTNQTPVLSSTLFKKSKKLIQNLQTMENRLLKLYEQFPSQQIQSVNAFFQAEVLNNLFTAHKLANIAAISDDKLMKMQKNMAINLFNNNIVYLILGFEENTHSLEILKKSDSVCQLFKYSFEKFNQIKKLQMLIPFGIRKIHHHFVSEFMETGKSRFFREINLTFIQNSYHYIQPVQLFFDIDFSNLQGFTFAAFLQDYPIANCFILIDDKNRIGGISENIFEKLGMKGSIKFQINIQNFLYNKNIDLLIPAFNKIVNNLKPSRSIIQEEQIESTEDRQSYKYLNVNFRFFKEDQFELEKSNKLQNSPKNLNIIDLTSNNSQQYQATILFHLHKRCQNTIEYSLIEIEEIKQLEKNINDINNSVSQNLSESFKNQQDAKSVPPNNQNFDFSQLDLSVEEQQPNFPNIIQALDQMSGGGDQDDQFGIKLQQIYQSKNNHQQNKIDVEEDIQKYNVIDSKNFQIQLISPKYSYNQLLFPNDPSKLIKQSYFQQKFLCNDNKVDSIEEFSKDLKELTMMKEKGKIKESENDKFDNDIYQNFMKFLRYDEIKDFNIVDANDIGSQVSSLAGIRRSKYYKKYEIISKLLESIKVPPHFKLMVFFILLMFIIMVIYCIIIIIYVDKDLKQFLQDIQMLQVNNQFIGPLHKFTLSQYSNLGYAVKFYRKQLSAADYALYSGFNKKKINQTYYNLKTNFDYQLSNPNLQRFFTDQYMIVQQVDYNTTKQYNITLRHALQLIQFHQYQFAYSIASPTVKTLDFLSPQFTYTYTNYLALANRFQSLGEEILNYTTFRTSSVQKKWSNVMIPFIVFPLILNAIAWFFYCRYIQRYEKFLELNKYIDMIWIQRDMERFRVIIDCLQKESNIVFNYKFDIDVKEQFLEEEDKRKEKMVAQRSKDKTKQLQMRQINYKLPKWFSLFGFLIIYGIYMLYLILVNLQTQYYLDKYNNTARFFKLISDSGTDLAGVFAEREICYFIIYKTFPYFTAADKDKFVEQIDQGMERLFEFQNFIVNFQMQLCKILQNIFRDEYMVTDDFIEFLNYYKSHNLCEILDNDTMQEAQVFCNNEYDGILKRGLVATINHLRNVLVNEKAINNFSVRPNLFILLELEVPLIVEESLLIIRNKMNDGLVKLTNDMIDVVQVRIYYQYFFQISSILYIFYSNLILSILIFFIYDLYYNEFHIVKRFFLLIPQSTIIMDQQFDRQFKHLVKSENLI